MRKIALHLVHYISMHIYGVISPLSLRDTRPNIFSSIAASSRVLFLKHVIIFVALHCASLGISMRAFVSNCIIRGREFQGKKNVRTIRIVLVALHTSRGFALVNRLLWTLSYKFVPNAQEDKSQ